MLTHLKNDKSSRNVSMVWISRLRGNRKDKDPDEIMSFPRFGRGPRLGFLPVPRQSGFFGSLISEHHFFQFSAATSPNCLLARAAIRRFPSRIEEISHFVKTKMWRGISDALEGQQHMLFTTSPTVGTTNVTHFWVSGRPHQDHLSGRPHQDDHYQWRWHCVCISVCVCFDERSNPVTHKPKQNLKKYVSIYSVMF